MDSELTPAEALLAARALLLVPFAAASIRLVQLPRAISMVRRLARYLPTTAVPGDDRTAWIVNGAASHVGARCLTTALVLHALLDRAGVPSRVVVGASRQDGRLKSHAWVERDGRPLSGSTVGWSTVWRSGS